MSDGGELDELFGEGHESRPEPRIRLVLVLLIVGLVGTIAGMCCLTAPGGLLVLAAWVLVEKELDRVDSGFLPLEERPALERIQQYVQAGLVLVLLLFSLQMILLCYGFYDQFWGLAFALLQRQGI